MATSNMSLFALTGEYQKLYNALMESVNEETGELDIDISKELEQVEGEFTAKAVAVATVYRKLKLDSSELDGEIKRLKAIKDRIDKQSDRVKEYLSMACESVGITNISGIYANISFRKSEETVIDNQDLLPAEYIVEKTTYSPDKVKIKAALKAGKEVQGAHIEEKQNIQIK